LRNTSFKVGHRDLTAVKTCPGNHNKDKDKKIAGMYWKARHKDLEMGDRNITQGSTVDKMERILKLDMTPLSKTEMIVESSLVK